MIRLLLLAALGIIAGCAPVPGRAGGIVSTNPCTDAILLRLVQPDQVAAISHYSQDPASTSLPIDVARRFRATAGTAEEVIALRPGLVLASSFTSPSTRDAFRRAGLDVLYVDIPSTIDASEAQVRQIAAAVNQRERGEAMIDAMQRAARPLPVAGTRPAALLFIAGDLATGGGTLLDEMMSRAGFRNAAADYGLRFTGRLPAELMVARPPAVMITPDEGRGGALRRRLLPRTAFVHFDRSLINCGGPTIVPAMARLRAIRASLS